jgi:hypothetical protein
MLGIRRGTSQSGFVSSLTFCFFVALSGGTDESPFFILRNWGYSLCGSLSTRRFFHLFGKEIRNFVSHHFLDNIKRFFCFFSKPDPSRLLFSSPFVYSPPLLVLCLAHFLLILLASVDEHSERRRL